MDDSFMSEETSFADDGVLQATIWPANKPKSSKIRLYSQDQRRRSSIQLVQDELDEFKEEIQR